MWKSPRTVAKVEKPVNKCSSLLPPTEQRHRSRPPVPNRLGTLFCSRESVPHLKTHDPAGVKDHEIRDAFPHSPSTGNAPRQDRRLFRFSDEPAWCVLRRPRRRTGQILTASDSSRSRSSHSMSGRPVKVSKSKLKADRSSPGGILAQPPGRLASSAEASARPGFEQRLSSCVLRPFEGLA